MCVRVLVGQPDDSVARLTTAGIAEFTAAYEAWDGARFDKAAQLFRQASTGPSATATTFYWLGAAQFHRMLQLQNPPAPAPPTNPGALDAARDASLTALLAAIRLDPGQAESHALLATLYGMKIDGSRLRAVWFGPRVVKHRDLALAAGPDNPRVRYLLGMGQFHTSHAPAAWREALATLLDAERLFDAEARRAAGPFAPRWGHSSCLTFIGRTYELLHERTKAAVYFRDALAEHPADGIAMAGLARVMDPQPTPHEP